MDSQNQQQPIEQPGQTKYKVYKKWWFWALLVLAVVLVAALGMFIFAILLEYAY